MGSNESHFNVSLIVRDSHKTVSRDHNFWTERRAKADLNWDLSAYQPNALLLGQTGLQVLPQAEEMNSPLRCSPQIEWRIQSPPQGWHPSPQRHAWLQTWLPHGVAECTQSCQTWCSHLHEDTDQRRKTKLDVYSNKTSFQLTFPKNKQ